MWGVHSRPNFLGAEGAGQPRGVPPHVVVDEEFDMWPPDLGRDEYQWPNLIGTAEEKAKMMELSVKYKPLFGPPPFGGSNLPEFHVTLKRIRMAATCNQSRPKLVAGRSCIKL